MRVRTVILFLICLPFWGFSQKGTDFQLWEDSLTLLRNKVMSATNEEERLSLNEDFMNLLEWVINRKGSFEYAWTKTENFSIVTSPDDFFKLYTWAVIYDDMSVENFGFIHYYNKYRKKFIVLPLYDKQLAISYPNTAITDHNMWYGAVYYKIIAHKSKDGQVLYTLLGHNGKDLFHQEKVIEVLKIRLKSSKPIVFGAKVFSKYPQKVARVIIPYSKNATLSLKFEEQSYDVKAGRDKKTKRVIYNTITTNMIIFESTIPMDDKMPEIPAFMVPESSLTEGFIPRSGGWTYIKNVNGRVPYEKMKPRTYNDSNFYKPSQNE